jgi:hypothetical protein
MRGKVFTEDREWSAEQSCRPCARRAGMAVLMLWHRTTTGQLPDVLRHGPTNALPSIQGAHKLSEDFAKPYFHKYWTEIPDVTAIWKRNVCSFIVALNAFDVRPHVWHGRCPGDTHIPAKPSQACLDCGVDVRALAILVMSLEVVGRKHCPWRNPTKINTRGVVGHPVGTKFLSLYIMYEITGTMK